MIKKVLKKIMLRQYYSSDTYVSFLKKRGCNIGDGTTFFAPKNTIIDLTRPWLINIGKNVQITDGVTILTHGYDWSVLKGKYGEILGSSGKVSIGDNVFIGVKTTILKGVSIGNNVIIGANSLVNKDIPDNSVVAGNPAKVICSIEDYYKKRKKEQLKEATEMTIEYYNKYNEWPSKKTLREFIFLFEKRSNNIINDDVFNEIGKLVNNYDYTLNKFASTKGKFTSYDDFISYCRKIKKGVEDD